MAPVQWVRFLVHFLYILFVCLISEDAQRATKRKNTEPIDVDRRRKSKSSEEEANEKLLAVLDKCADSTPKVTSRNSNYGKVFHDCFYDDTNTFYCRPNCHANFGYVTCGSLRRCILEVAVLDSGARAEDGLNQRWSKSKYFILLV